MEKPTPLDRREFTSKLIDPVIPGTNPTPPGQMNRGEQVSVGDDTVKPINVGLEDHDAAVQYYFENVIRPSVMQGGQKINVPVVVSSAEKFKSVQTDGFYRDKNGKVMVPLITYKRESFTKNRDLGNKLDGNNVNNIQTFKQKFSKRNVYDNFSVLNNIKPQVAYTAVVVPDYITITYTCLVFTNYVEQQNKLLEGIQFANDSYWGDPKKFQFRVRIEEIPTMVNLEQDTDRAVKSEFKIILNGYLIPDTINKDLALKQNKIYDKTKVTFTTEVVSTLPK